MGHRVCFMHRLIVLIGRVYRNDKIFRQDLRALSLLIASSLLIHGLMTLIIAHEHQVIGSHWILYPFSTFAWWISLLLLQWCSIFVLVRVEIREDGGNMVDGLYMLISYVALRPWGVKKDQNITSDSFRSFCKVNFWKGESLQIRLNF